MKEALIELKKALWELLPKLFEFAGLIFALIFLVQQITEMF